MHQILASGDDCAVHQAAELSPYPWIVTPVVTHPAVRCLGFQGRRSSIPESLTCGQGELFPYDCTWANRMPALCFRHPQPEQVGGTPEKDGCWASGMGRFATGWDYVRHLGCHASP
jgi:hypothetical protein